ncbi:hypothetical protein GCM10007216_09700 [Thalassobacillus devorans]|uniref:WYL domain-containing protein n=1 Tax=Thalassobacillus devorans TaxID=279813 RepID=A0ABQ1NRM8_9BACI|nr:hypothetical protein [Thalassobacillus devorans]NIK29091.1 putative DNA-binding transcriptional regulator YafY [Thalassobacillus devorans]GGC81220.1 hypothetical protein GCM10007216_09700 [Thalassobacillus devorans]
MKNIDNILSRAKEDGKTIELIYLSKGNDFTHRVVKVLRVNEEEILAFCYIRRQVRRFKKANILSAAPARNKKGA